MKKITLDSVKNEVIGGASAGAGVVGGSLLMKMAGGSLNSISPWLTPLIAILAGYGIRITVDNEMLKDVGTGVLTAGVLAAVKQAITQFGGSVAALQTISASIPQLNGPTAPALLNNYLFNAQPNQTRANLQGMRGIGSGVGFDQVNDARKFSSALFE